ncbi:MAG: hypothetical protein WD512_15735 [Candidatus Paceibacterota bacterium]
MKHFIILVSITIFLSSCTSEPKEYNFKASIKNESSVLVTITGYDSANNLKINEIINPNETKLNCEGLSEFFQGYICGGDSLIFKFPNGKGYICAGRITNNQPELCFPNKTPFGNDPSFVDLGNRNYQFIITEEDYNNAFDLP